MINHQNRFSYVFGDRNSPFQLPALAGSREDEILQEAALLKRAASYLPVQKLVVLKQTHSAKGYLITDSHNLENFSFRAQEGDYIITTLPSIGIGIATADCLPILLYDPVHHAVAAVHAGWKGIVGNIIPIALQQMARALGTAYNSLEIFIGPSAQHCCYEVQPSFINNLTSLTDYEKFLTNRHQQLYFDLPAAALQQLIQSGVSEDKISNSSNQCTICTPSFYSYRRSPDEAQRQLSIIRLK